ncbi:fimbrial protein [Burkholderia sp. AU6039]|uniref:fimbrial protein n=1 Tax=Burkholderia sp. AU6039 TaxID=2015344 RepID=UPI0015C59668|nr:fimbrial protein [Burkholderia sp. AU6039]
MQLTRRDYSPLSVMTRKLMAQCLGALCLVWFVFFSSEAHAISTCWSSWGGNWTVTPVPAQNITAAMDALAPGTMLSSTATATTGDGKVIPLDQTPECIDSAGRRIAYEVTRTPLPGVTYQANGASYYVFDSGVQGIGYALEVRAGTPASDRKWVPVNTMSTPLATTRDNSATFFFEMRVIVVYTGRLKSGSYSVPEQRFGGRFAIYGAGRGNLQTSNSLSWQIASIKVAQRTCKLASGTPQDVVLPRIVTTSFPDSIGAVARNGATSFALQLDCDRDVKVHATMTDASNPTNTSDMLSAARQSTASGVGIQITRPNEPAPVKFGPDSPANGTVNQWYAGTSPVAGGGLTLPFVAKYVRTAPKITAGSVFAISTITFSYQ